MFPHTCANNLPTRLRASGERASLCGKVSVHSLDPLRARRPRLKRIAKVLSLASDLPAEEFHDTHSERGSTVIAQDIFGDPEVTRPDNAPHSEALPIGLRGARR